MATHENSDRSIAVEAFIRMQHGTYITINDVLIDALGDIQDAVYLSKLMYWSKYTDDDGWFTRKMATIERTLGLSRRQQDASRKRLVERGLIEVARKGLPAQFHYRILWDAVVELAAATPPRLDGFESDDYDESNPVARFAQSRVSENATLQRHPARHRVSENATLHARSSQSLTLEKQNHKETLRRSPSPKKILPIWERLDPVTDRTKILSNKLERPTVPTMSQVNGNVDLLSAWLDLQEEYDKRHRR